MAEFSEDKTDLITGLHSVTFSCGDARANNRFWTEILGLRRVKQTVDYDSPDCYRLYYGNENGAAGTLISALVRPKTGHELPPAERQKENPRRVGQHHAVFAVRKGALPFWRQRLQKFGIAVSVKQRFGAVYLCFRGPCGERLEMTENTAEKRSSCFDAAERGIAPENAVCGLHSLSLAVWNKESVADFLALIGYRHEKSEAGISRFVLPRTGRAANGARIADIEEAASYPTDEEAAAARLEPGAVAHIAFAAAGDLTQLQEIFLDKGYKIGGLRDNDYYTSFYLYAPQGAVVEMAAAEPDFAKDESKTSLGAALCLPKRLEHLRHFIESRLEKLAA